MKEPKPPWIIEDRVSISKKARRLQELIEEELKRRETGIPKEHWRWAGIDDEPYVKPELRLVDADYEIYKPNVSESLEKRNTWDFYFFLLSLGAVAMVGSWVIIDSIIRFLRGVLLP